MSEKHHTNKTAIIISTIVGIFLLFVLIVVVIGSNQTQESKPKQTQTVKQEKKKKKDGVKLVKIDKDTNIVNGTLKVHFIGTKYETVKNDSDNYTDAEYNMEGNPSHELNPKYYRATVYFTIENVGTKAVDSSTNERAIILDDGTSLDAFGHGHGTGSALEDRSTDTIQPKTKLNDAIIIVSNNKIQADHPKIQFGRLYEPSADAPFADGGIAAIQ